MNLTRTIVGWWRAARGVASDSREGQETTEEPGPEGRRRAANEALLIFFFVVILIQAYWLFVLSSYVGSLEQAGNTLTVATPAPISATATPPASTPGTGR